MDKMSKTIATGILTTMLIGLITAFIGMYTDIHDLKARERGLKEKINEVHQDVREIKWFLIEKNGGNINKKR